MSIGDPGPLVVLTSREASWALRWGQPHHIGSCAYWIDQTRCQNPIRSHALGDTLREEIAACLLGGYGIRAEVATAAYKLIRSSGLLTSSSTPSPGEIEAVLRRRLLLGPGHEVHYRFPAQRARRLAAALAFTLEQEAPARARDLRDWLLTIPGIGPKTASWVVRNNLNSDEVAIIDVHVRRAGVSAGFFDERWRLPRDYLVFEKMFLTVARLGGVPASALDACIWGQSHRLTTSAHALLG
jgi:N-glycosylase/DNA lyase